MIGQKHLLKIIEDQIAEGTFPRFSILVGMEGSGRKLMAKHIATKLDAQPVFIDGKVEQVRQVIKVANAAFIKTLYVFVDADKMSANAENALLKFLEEPPNNAYILLTAESEYNLLPTVRSRGMAYYMDLYNPMEIEQYLVSYMPIPPDGEAFKKIFKDTCETPGDVQVLAKMNAEDFYKYVNLVVDNIAEVVGANALKIGNKIALKAEESDKYDLKMFFKVFIDICLKKQDSIHARWVKITNQYLRQLSTKGINKLMLFDSWVLDIREITFKFSNR